MNRGRRQWGCFGARTPIVLTGNRNRIELSSFAEGGPMSQTANLIEKCRRGDQEAARILFDSYVERLLPLARRRISQRLLPRVDPEDVIQSVFRTFFARLKDGQFSIADQNDL